MEPARQREACIAVATVSNIRANLFSLTVAAWWPPESSRPEAKNGPRAPGKGLKNGRSSGIAKKFTILRPSASPVRIERPEKKIT
jgi:hypothetical protein